MRQAVAIDAHMLGCADCRADCAEQKSMNRAIKDHAARYPAPALLASRIMAALPATPPAPPAASTIRSRRWFNAAAVLVSAVLLAGSVGLYLTMPSARDRLAQEVISNHVRSLMADHIADIASSDQHTVKPWFNGKLDFSPVVRDLTAQGFPLIGGRLDYLDNRAVAALVYRHRQHVINLFVSPVIRDRKHVPTQGVSMQGYHLLHWATAGMDFWAVSDLNPPELRRFEEILLSPEGN
jgi:anti-sigma factor RsiW